MELRPSCRVGCAAGRASVSSLSGPLPNPYQDMTARPAALVVSQAGRHVGRRTATRGRRQKSRESDPPHRAILAPATPTATPLKESDQPVHPSIVKSPHAGGPRGRHPALPLPCSRVCPQLPAIVGQQPRSGAHLPARPGRATHGCRQPPGRPEELTTHPPSCCEDEDVALRERCFTWKVLLELVRNGPQQSLLSQVRGTFQVNDTNSRHPAMKPRG